MKFTLLAIETATEACSAAIIHQERCYFRDEVKPKAHSELILPMVAALLTEAHISLKDLTHVAVGRGPGSFTGVRIGVGIAQGLAFGLNLPIYPISTLEALAYQAQQKSTATVNHIFPLLDARMQEVYGAIYQVESGQLHCLEEDLYSPGDFLGKTQSYPGQVLAIGSGWDVYGAKEEGRENQSFFSWCHPHAKDIAYLAQQRWCKGVEGIAACDLQPVYLRDKVAKKSGS